MPKSETELRAELEVLGLGLTWSAALVRPAAQRLLKDEKILDGIEGQSARDGKRGDINVALLVTSLRALRIDWGRPYTNPSPYTHNYPANVYWQDVANVIVAADERYLSISGYSLAAGSASVSFEKNSVPEDVFLQFCERVQRKVAEIKVRRSHSTGGAEASFVDELERLSVLREAGALTEEEFQVAKRKLLAP